MRRTFDRVGLIAVFANMLQSLGGIFTPFDSSSAPDANPKKRRPSGRFAPHALPMRMDGYYMDNHGSLRRRRPKRLKSMSARQWRKLRNQARAERQSVNGGAQ